MSDFGPNRLGQLSENVFHIRNADHSIGCKVPHRVYSRHHKLPDVRSLDRQDSLFSFAALLLTLGSRKASFSLPPHPESNAWERDSHDIPLPRLLPFPTCAPPSPFLPFTAFSLFPPHYSPPALALPSFPIPFTCPLPYPPLHYSPLPGPHPPLHISLSHPKLEDSEKT